jgi:hypothetical protein
MVKPLSGTVSALFLEVEEIVFVVKERLPFVMPGV